MKLFAASLLASLFAMTAQAGLLNVKTGSKTREGVALAESATESIAGGTTIELFPVGSGLRTKKVLITNVKVYVGELLVSSPARIEKTADGLLKSLEDNESVAIRLTFLRTVEAEKVQVSFEDGLNANKIDLKDADIVNFLKTVGAAGDAEVGKTLTFVIRKNSDGTETFAFENTKGDIKTMVGSRGLTLKIFSLWFGASADDGVAKFKKQVLE